jgi:hypothetical protein
VEGLTEPGVDLRINGISTLVLANGSFSRFVGLIEGGNPISVIATDLAGNFARIDLTVYRDTIPPPLIVTEPSSGVWVNYPTVIVKGTSEQGATVSVGGQLAVVQSDGSFEVPVALVEGDMAGNSASAQVTVNVDTIPPYLLVSNPDDGLLTNTNTVQASGMTEPSTSLTINGLPVTVQPDGSFTTTVTLQIGQNDIFFNVTDLAGNTNSVMRSVTLDQSPPILTIQAPADGTITNKPFVQVQGSTEPMASLVVNGQFFQVDANGDFDGMIPLADGDNLVVVTACDPAGNCATETRNVFVDTESPEADAGNDVEILEGVEYNFDGSDSSDNDQIEDYEWKFRVNGNEIELEESDPSYIFSSVGVYEVTLEVTDRAGNSDEDTLWVKVIPPDDVDEDGIPDSWEIENFGGTAFGPGDDPDLDYLNNYEEYLVGTDPNDADTDGDGLKDGLDDDPLVMEGLGIEDFWWIFVVVIVVLLVLILLMIMRSREKLPPPPDDEVLEEPEPPADEVPIASEPEVVEE